MPLDGTLEGHIGAVDNLSDPKPVWNREATVISMTVVFCVLTSACVGLRLYTRFWILKLPGWDDYWMILVLSMGGIGTICMCMLPSLGGLGRHWLELSPTEQQNYFKLFYIADGSFVATVSQIKLCILLQYLRLFDSGLRRQFCLFMLGVVGIWAAVTFFIVWFPCFPVHAYWDWSVENAKCYAYGSKHVASHYATFLSHSIVNMVLDLVIFAMPLPLFFKWSTQHRTKLGLGALLLLGVITNVFAALRLSETVRHRAMSYPTFDHPWYAPTLCTLGMLEVNFACIGASVPVFWPVFRDKMGTIFVTREINVSVAARSSSDVHLQRAESLHSQDGSDGSNRLWQKPSADGSRADHYKDTYVLQQVDPLRAKTALAVDTLVSTGDIGRSRNKGQDLRHPS